MLARAWGVDVNDSIDCSEEMIKNDGMCLHILCICATIPHVLFRGGLWSSAVTLFCSISGCALTVGFLITLQTIELK